MLLFSSRNGRDGVGKLVDELFFGGTETTLKYGKVLANVWQNTLNSSWNESKKKKSMKLKKKKKIEGEGGPYDYCMFLEAAVKILPGTAAGADLLICVPNAVETIIKLNECLTCM